MFPFTAFRDFVQVPIDAHLKEFLIFVITWMIEDV